MTVVTQSQRTSSLWLDQQQIIIDLPFPPSVNQIWRRSGEIMHRSGKYVHWIKDADRLVLLHRTYPSSKIESWFEAAIVFDEGAGRGDLDNRLKAVLDWAQSREIIVDDKFCRRLIAAWVPHGSAPHGCKLTLRSVQV